MPIYNNPAIGQAFASLGEMFAPPSGQDAAAWAVANAKNAEAQRRAELYAGAAGDPDRQAVIADLYDPTQSYHAVGLNNAATLRGQDIAAQTSIANNAADNARARYGIDVGSGDARYGVDVGARTSVANNAADNARALQDRTLQEQGSLERLFAAPITVARGARTFLPGQTAAATGLSPVLDGPAAPLNESETIATVLQGMRPEDQQRIIEQKYAMSGDQVKGDILRMLAGSGSLSQDQINRAAGISDPDVEKVVGEDGKPTFATRAEAVGQQAYVGDTAAKPTNALAVMPDGSRLPAIQRPDGTWANARDGAPLQGDFQIFDTPKPQGTAQEVGIPGKPTEFADRNAIFYNRASPADLQMRKLQESGYVPAARDFELILGGAGNTLPLSISNNLVSPEGRQFYNSAMNFMNAVLRPDTGAAFGKEEFANYARVFIPLPGDDPATVSNKAVARSTALAALQGTSRGSADAITKLMMDQGLEVPPEMQKRMAASQAQTAGPAGGSQVTSDPPPEVIDVASPEEAMKLPSGTKIRLPDGSPGVVP